MPAFLLSAFETYILPQIIQLVVTLAVKHGLVSTLDANLLKFGMSIKIYSKPDDYPSGEGKDGPSAAVPTPNNLHTGGEE